jgi:hypothetical protein
MNASIAPKRWRWLVALHLNRSSKILCAIVAIAAYALTAYWLKVSYLPPVRSETEPKVAGTKLLLRRPYLRFLDSDFVGLADTADNNERSPVQIYEDDKPLGPAHSSHAGVAKTGRGRFSHWERNGGAIFVFSSSDNSDPQTNGRAYWAVKPGMSDSPPRP